MYEDKTLVCRDCGNEFVFTAGEQEFFAQRGFQNEPARCKDCRTVRKSNRLTGGEKHVAVCADCGGPAELNFVPKDDRPVYCSACFAARRQAMA